MKTSKDKILNYLNNKLSEKERHAFEKLMLEDPFLNDAVEGLQNIENPETVDVLLNELDQQIQTNSGKKVSPGNTRWMMAVAAILIVAITSIVVLYFPKNLQNDILSLNQVPENNLKEKTEDVGTEIETTETIKNEKKQITADKEEQITGVDEEKIFEE